jgi:hypothetical protein
VELRLFEHIFENLNEDFIKLLEDIPSEIEVSV